MFQNLVRNVSKTVIENISSSKHKYTTNQLYFVCGPMGSGKTTYINTNLLQNEDIKAYYSNIDDLISYFKKETDDPRQLYQLTRQVGIIVTDYFLENHISMVIEGTGINMDTIEYFERLKKNGYQINTIFMKTELNTCRHRVKLRNETASHKVLDEDIIKYYQILWDGDDGKTKMEKLISDISDNVTYVDNYSITKLK